MASLLSQGAVGTEEERSRWSKANELLKGKDVEVLNNEKAQLYGQIAEINRQMRELRKEIILCDTISATAPQLQGQLRVVRAEDTLQQQGGNLHEHERW